MTTRRPRTAQIKPATRNAIMDQLALAASEIERQRGELSCLRYANASQLQWPRPPQAKPPHKWFGYWPQVRWHHIRDWMFGP